jgi:hypothetical protein
VYASRIGSKLFRAKLGVHNVLATIGSLGKSKWITAEEIGAAIKGAKYRIGGDTVRKVADGFIFGGRESLSYLNKTIADHELLHVGQYLRKPEIRDSGIAVIYHEFIPSFLGTPEIYVTGTAAGVGGSYGVYQGTRTILGSK